jgi:quinol monooxygenase YgiN
MFTRVVACQAMSGGSEAVVKKVKEEVLPILQEEGGFVDLLVLSDKTDPERLVFVTLWISQGDAETYQRHHYDTIANMLGPVLKSPPRLQLFAVLASTAHRLFFDQAA